MHPFLEDVLFALGVCAAGFIIGLLLLFLATAIGNL